MDYDLGPDAARLRDRLRRLLAEHVPEDYLSPFSDDPADVEISEAFVKVLADEGLLTMAWPRAYGGTDAGPWLQTVVREEMWAHYEPRGSHYMGLNWAGPTIMRFGSERQKEFFLPRIASGEITWCQGFSEPDAGTDLASLRTFARRVDDGWRINGQKVWNSYATMANWCIAAVRTSREGRKQDGLTLFMIPIDQPGLELRPIASMLGPQHLNELFFEDVPATDENVLGEVDGGWSVMRYALTRERVGIARYARADRLLERELELLGDAYDELPVALRSRVVLAAVRNRIARLLAYRVTDHQDREQVTDAQAGAARILTTLVEQEVADVLMEIGGNASLKGKSSEDAPLGGAIEDFWRYTNASTVASGSIDVQRMHVARSVLGSERGSRAS